MAEALFNEMAKGKSKIVAISAGTRPATQIDHNVIETMREINIDIEEQKPKLLTLETIENADRVIAMGCGVQETCPAGFIPTEDWELDDPGGKTIDEVRNIRDQITTKVKALYGEL